MDPRETRPPGREGDASAAPAAPGAEAPDRETGQEDEATGAAGATSGIPVVGLGGSAGALESFKRFLAAMPADSGAAFVVIQHLPPSRSSLLAETPRPAHPDAGLRGGARDGRRIELVYVMPPDRHLGIRDGILYLAEPATEHDARMPIDFFFRALAEDRRERAVGVLLSGAGSDGTLGMRAVRGAGGLTMAQDHTAQFGEMPRSAVATGLVD